MKTRKVLTLIVSAIMTTSIFAGCSSKAANESTTGSDTKKTDTKTENVTLTFWHTYSEGEAKVLKDKVIPKFEADHKNIKIKSVVMPYDGLKQQVIQAVSGNTSPDLMRMDIVWTPEFAKMGALADVDNLDGFSTLKDKFFQAPLQTNYYNL
jgi:multiple sugar transport system substrate-binding protein